MSLMLVSVLVAGCATPTQNVTPSTAQSPALTSAAGKSNATYRTIDTTALGAQLASKYRIVRNITRLTNGTPPTYRAAFQENSTLHDIIIIVAASSSEARQQFERQVNTYGAIAGQNSTVIANTSTNWAVRSGDQSYHIWAVEPNTVGPFGLTLDVPYVLIVQDFTPTGELNERAS
jgi:hypothetical protein